VLTFNKNQLIRSLPRKWKT